MIFFKYFVILLPILILINCTPAGNNTGAISMDPIIKPTPVPTTVPTPVPTPIPTPIPTPPPQSEETVLRVPKEMFMQAMEMAMASGKKNIRVEIVGS